MHADQASQPGAPTVECHFGVVPCFIGPALEQLYGTLHSSLPFFETFRSLSAVNCYVVRSADVPTCILLFALDGTRAEVLNEMIEIAAADVARFSNYVFARFVQVDTIHFRAVRTEHPDGHPLQRYHARQTWFIQLPARPADYLAQLGKSTRASILSQTNRVVRAFPSFVAECHVGAGIDAAHVRQVIGLSERAIRASGGAVRYDVDAILALARRHGMLTILLIDGQVCAGSVNYRIGANYFGEVIGYDRRYEKFGVGKLCAHQTICDSIERGGSRFFLGGGEFEFKQRMRGIALPMDELQIFRSYLALALNADRAVALALAAQLRRIKNLLHRHRRTRLARAVFACHRLFAGAR